MTEYERNEMESLRRTIGNCHEHSAKQAARIARLELTLRQIINSCVDDDDKSNELFRFSPGEIRKLASSAL